MDADLINRNGVINQPHNSVFLFGSSLFLLRIRDPILMRLIRYPDGWNKGVLFRI